jgi:hypothetical protein
LARCVMASFCFLSRRIVSVSVFSMGRIVTGCTTIDRCCLTDVDGAETVGTADVNARWSSGISTISKP